MAINSQDPNGRGLSGPFRRVITGLAMFAAICLFAVVGYLAAGWKLADSVYMVIITIFGVGYGEVQPVESAGLRLLTILVIIAGYGAVIYTIGGFVQMLIDGEINEALGVRRMKREIDQLESHSIICGFGRMGTILARELQADGQSFVVIDNGPSHVQEAEELGCLAILGDATDEHVLERAGIARAAVLATVLSDDATNVFITITARELSRDIMIIARGENPRTERKLLGCGANKVVLPAAIGASQVGHLILRPTAESLLSEFAQMAHMKHELELIGLRFDELVVASHAKLAGHPLSEIELRSNHGFLIVAVRRADGETVVNPPPETKLNSGDSLVVLGHDDDLPQLAERLSASSPQLTYRGAAVDR